MDLKREPMDPLLKPAVAMTAVSVALFIACLAVILWAADRADDQQAADCARICELRGSTFGLVSHQDFAADICVCSDGSTAP